MIFRIDLSGAKPVYLQMIDQVKYAVATGAVLPGDRLPPIRDVAAQLRVNRNTVARVYAELEREGIVYSRPGQGCFVSDRGSVISRSEQTRQLSGRLDEIIAQARLFGAARDEVTRLFRERLDEVYQTDGREARSPEGEGESS